MTLERIEHKVFASEAPLEEMGQFGSALATTKLNTKDVAEIQALPAYTKGWGSAIISENNYPAMEEMNGVLNVMSYHTGYLYQEGIPIYSATQEYSVTSWVKDLAGEKVYKSLQGGNKGHDLTDPAWWEELKLGGGGLEIGDVGFTQMAIDETKGKRRVLNGQVIIQDQYVQFTNIIKNSVALNPDLACTEAEWQTAVTMNTFGLCGKFVIDDEGGTIRLPKYPNYFIAGLANIAPVVGNGYAMIWNDTVRNYGMKFNTSGDTNRASYFTTDVPVAVGTEMSTAGTATYNLAMGLSQDSSMSGIEAQIKQEKIKGTYFIQVATGAETEDNIINEIELNNPFSLLDYKYSEYELNNLSWLRSNGQWNAKAVYPAVYDLLLKIYNGTETKAGVSVKLSTGSYTDYDFVLNTAEETFRLPTKVKLASGKAVVGNEYGLGFDSGQGQNGIYGYLYDDTAETGNYVQGFYSNTPRLKSDTSFTYNEGFLDEHVVGILTKEQLGEHPEYSGIETSDSDLYLYFYVGETVQNANLINAGRIEEKLTDLHVDINNIQNEKLDKSAVKAYITQTYVSGTSGYRIWSDKYCEQWGRATSGGNDAKVTLLKAYANTNYSVLMIPMTNGNANGISYGWTARTTAKDYFNFDHLSSNNPWGWRTWGYLA